MLLVMQALGKLQSLELYLDFLLLLPSLSTVRPVPDSDTDSGGDRVRAGDRVQGPRQS